MAFVGTGRALLVGGQSVGNPSFSLDFLQFGSVIPMVSGGMPTITTTRATAATIDDQDGILRTSLIGEMRFRGFRRVENLCPTPSTTIAVSGNKTITVGIGTFVFSMGAEATASSVITFTGTATGSTGTLTANATNRTAKTLTITVGGTIIATCTVAAANNIQFENVTGQTNQNPGEYINVGVLSAPYHGTGAEGVKVFPYSNGNTVASGVVTEAKGAAISSSILQGFLPEAAATNLCLQSNAFTTTWAALGTPAATQNVTGPDGIANSAWTMTDNAAGAAEGVSQAINLTAAAYTMSVFVAKTVGAQASYPVLEAITGTVCALCTVDTSNGTATVWTAYTGRTMLASASARCTSFNSTFWRVELTYTATVAAYTHSIYCAGTAVANQSTGVVDVSGQGTAVVYGAQVELGSFATTYVPTTTIAVARNADLLTYTLGTWYNTVQGTLFADWLNPSVAVNYVAVSINDGTTGERIQLSGATITTLSSAVVTGFAVQSALNAAVLTGGATARAVNIYKANDFAGFGNNTTLGTDVAGTLPTPNRIEIGSEAGASQLGSPIRKISYYPIRMVSAVAQSLTV